MKRRTLLRLAGWSGIAATLGPGFRTYAADETYTGPLFMTVQVSGGWDVTSFCDPKLNQTGEEIINNWAEAGEIQQAGNISYAPFGGNQAFFDKYFQDILIINGVDAQTNSHSAGVTHNWSGRLSEGYPTITALAASIYGGTMPMGYVSGGGYQETANLVRYTSLSDPEGLRELIEGNTTAWNPNQSYRDPADLERVKQYQLARLEAMMAREDLTPRQRHGIETFYQARLSRDQLSAFAELLPDNESLQPTAQPTQGVNSTLARQAQVSLIGMQAGVSMAADLHVRGFDTHSEHDADHEPMMQHLTETLDYLWTEAEILGLADRLTVFVSSDFGRTPRYNSSEGKDHWPIGSAMFMQKNASWTNRVVGQTDEFHNAINLDPSSLAVDEADGRHIYPADVHQAMRVVAGIDQHDNVLAFPVSTGEDMDLLNGG